MKSSLQILFFYLIIIPKSPKIPNKIKIILDSISIVVEEILLLSHFPRNRAMESLVIIPQIAPKIKDNLKWGYSIPNPIEARKVLSPNSPIAIVVATIIILFLKSEFRRWINLDLVLVELGETGDVFFNFIKPITPKNIKVKYVKSFR